MEGVRGFMQSPVGKGFSIVVSIAALLLGIYVVRAAIQGDTPGDPNNATYVCSETGKAFKHRNVVGEDVPVLSPYTGRNTGYPGEPCYWTASGQPKDEPTWVLLNETVGKSGPTFCPDCGRLVVAHNPAPEPGMKPPPTQQEYAARRVSHYSSQTAAQDARQ
jgi:hypothetical protein